MKFNKKALSSIIAISLLIILTSITVISFQNWFEKFSKDSFIKIEKENLNLNSLNIENVINKNIYIKNNLKDNIPIEIIKIGNKNCLNESKINLTYGINIINIEDCLIDINGIEEVTIISREIILSKKILFNKDKNLLTNENNNCSSLNGIQLNHFENFEFYNSIASNNCESEIRTCNNGLLSGNESFQYSSCTTLYFADLSCLLDFDSDSHYDPFCAYYPMQNFSFNGHLDVNYQDPYTYTNTMINCLFNDDKSSSICLDLLIINGCGTGTILDRSSGLCWIRDFELSNDKNWEDSILYCNSLNFAGHSDWRLPSRLEMHTLIDLSRVSPPIKGGSNEGKFENFQNIWSATSSAVNQSRAFGMSNGYATGLGIFSKSDLRRSVCVR